jgi:hypothetical protein
MATEIQSKYMDLLHDRMMDREVICLLLEALGGEFVLGDTTEIIEGTSNREFVTTYEKGVGYKMTLVYRPEKPGFLVTCGPGADDIPEVLEGTLNILPSEAREDDEED